MAKDRRDDTRRSEGDDADEPRRAAEAEEGEGLVVAGEAASIEPAQDGPSRDEGGRDEGSAAEPDRGPAGQLGTERYVLAGFFAAGLLAAYVLGRAIESVWASLANRDWFAQALPAIAAVNHDDRATYGTILGGIIAAVVVLRLFRKPDVRAWSRDVAAELTKVKWPTKKDVSNSTIVVIAASTVATVYLALLDRLWAFITNLVYGDGS